MTEPSPRLRAAWRIGSALAAGVGTAVAASALARHHTRSRAHPVPGTEGPPSAPPLGATGPPTTLVGTASAAPGWAEVDVAAESVPAPAVDPLAATDAPGTGTGMLAAPFTGSVADPDEATAPAPPAPATLATAIEAASAAADALRATADAVATGWVPPSVPVRGLPPESGEIPAITAAMAAPTDQTVTSAASAMPSALTPAQPTPAVDHAVAAVPVAAVPVAAPEAEGERKSRRFGRRAAGGVNGTSHAETNGSAPTIGAPAAAAPPPPPLSRPAPPVNPGRSGGGPVVLPVPPAGDSDGGDGSSGSNLRNTLMAGAAMLVAVVLIGIAFVLLSGDGDSSDDTTRAGDTDEVTDPQDQQATSTPVAQLSPDQAFAQAAERLESAGTYAYHGTSSATDVSPVRPGPWLGVNLTIDGQVQLATTRFIERGTADDGTIADTVTDGVTIWGRTGTSVDELAELPLETIYTLPDPTPAKVGGLLLPGWLSAVTGAADAGTDPQGRRVFQATLPAAVLGPLVDDEAPSDALVRLALDEAGNPAHIEVQTVGGPPFSLNVNLLRIGEEMPIQVPSDATSGSSDVDPSTIGDPGSTDADAGAGTADGDGTVSSTTPSSTP